MEYVTSGKISHATSPGRSGGVMIGILHAIPWIINYLILDKSGCFVILLGKLLNLYNLLVVRVYAPNRLQTLLWEIIFEILQEDPESEVLIMGDFNLVLDNQLYTTPSLPVNFHRYKLQKREGSGGDLEVG